MRAKDLVKANIAYHHTLNQDVWDGDELRVDVRYKLLEIAQRFIEYLEVPKFQLKDVILRGSLVNYNYTQYSDFDLHLVTDYADLGCDITEQFYMAKKKIWNDEHDITIYNYDVELFVQDANEAHFSSGVYSVLHNKWLVKPKKEDVKIDTDLIKTKAKKWMDIIDQVIDHTKNEPLALEPCSLFCNMSKAEFPIKEVLVPSLNGPDFAMSRDFERVINSEIIGLLLSVSVTVSK